MPWWGKNILSGEGEAKHTFGKENILNKINNNSKNFRGQASTPSSPLVEGMLIHCYN